MAAPKPPAARYLGLDVGAETIKIVGLAREGETVRIARRTRIEHGKDPTRALCESVASWEWDGVAGAAATGRFSRQVNLPRVPIKQAIASGARYLLGDGPVTLVSIGSRGFSVLELREGGTQVFRENGRCSQGTGNFLHQLVDRFGLSVEEASALAVGVADPAPLSGRCPVILKTDMTHLANKGESRPRILAGLFDAVCENVQVLIKRTSPRRLALVGAVSLSRRVRDHFRRFAERTGMSFVPLEEDALFVEALGAALAAAEDPVPPPPLSALVAPPEEVTLERLPSLAASLESVRRMPPPIPEARADRSDVILGLDIGSTGSKLVALDAASSAILWQTYAQTAGNPVGAAQELVRRFAEGPAATHPVRAVGVTGSGREIVGSLLATCYGADPVFVLNEIAAHAEGALHYDPRVDTIFEIGGQDAKYIRLSGGRVVDAAMNEACSAGTGSFIEEQGRKLAGIRDIVHLGQVALEAETGVSLGQHCSVLMAEVIDEAVARGVEQPAIVAGIYDSIVQNYLNRVKGSRTVGSVVFCQGMPFASAALAAAVARQTGSQVVVPPNPGTVGALGIALLARKAIALPGRGALDPARFLAASVERKDTFVCRSATGCGGPGNRCRIDRIHTAVEGRRSAFTWGGGCSLWDRGTRRAKLPDRPLDPFHEREELVRAHVAPCLERRGRPVVALGGEFMLKSFVPFFATFLFELGFDLLVADGADQAMLKRGIEEATVPFCAPMQQFHGLVSQLAEARPDALFLPMIRELPRVGTEGHSKTCPIVQGAADILRHDLNGTFAGRIVSPVVDFGAKGFDSEVFRDSCRRLATDLGAEERLDAAFDAARRAQARFEAGCQEIGARALAFAAERTVVPVVVLGRPYTIYNSVLNSNVPAILREQGALAIPLDCYPVDPSVPVFDQMFWGWGQRILRAADQVRHAPGVYSVYCSNYSCGPDSFNLHFYAYVMEGKPFAVIETDGHSGDAGTKTRVEAFLHCVREHLRAAGAQPCGKELRRLERANAGLPDIHARGETLLIPRMGPGAEIAAACLRGYGLRAESLPLPTSESLRLGRRHTSGKECVPMAVTLGSVLERLERARGTAERFALLLPGASGPCRFGSYNLLHKIVYERLGWDARLRILSPGDYAYFEGVPGGFSTLFFASVMASDLLLGCLHDVRPVEREPGVADALYRRFSAELQALVEREAGGNLSVSRGSRHAVGGRFFGIRALLSRAAGAFAQVKTGRAAPTVMVVGEIYARCDPFTNDFVIDKLEGRGLRVKLAPVSEWLEYTDWLALESAHRRGFWARFFNVVQGRIQRTMYGAVASTLAWAPRVTVRDIVGAASTYLRAALEGEAVLTLGAPLAEWQHGHIDAVVSVGPMECMPTKIAEALFFHAAEREGLPSLTISVNGDPVDPVVLDNFAYEVHSRFRRRSVGRPAQASRGNASGHGQVQARG